MFKCPIHIQLCFNHFREKNCRKHPKCIFSSSPSWLHSYFHICSAWLTPDQVRQQQPPLCNDPVQQSNRDLPEASLPSFHQLFFFSVGKGSTKKYDFLSDPGVPGPIYGSSSLSQTKPLCADLTDVTLADEDTNSILDNANMAIQGNMAMQILQSGCHL